MWNAIMESETMCVGDESKVRKMLRVTKKKNERETVKRAMKLCIVEMSFKSSEEYYCSATLGIREYPHVFCLPSWVLYPDFL